MNSDQLANLISLGFGVFILYCFAHGFFMGATENTVKISDKIDIGYIRETPEKQSKSPDIKAECCRVLIAIGYSPETAKHMVRDFFKKDTAKDLEEFFVKINKP